MRILFVHGTPVPLRHNLVGHDVKTAHEMGWSAIDNGALLKAAETAFDLFVTTDRNLRHQQKLAGRRLAVLVLSTTSWPRIQRHVAKVVEAANAMREGEVREVEVPA